MVTDVDLPLSIDRDAEGTKKLTVLVAQVAPLGQELAITVELLNTTIARVGDVHVAASIHGQPAILAVELTGLAPVAAPHGEQVPLAVQLLDREFPASAT